MRRAAKRDESEPIVVEALEASGAYVLRMHKPVDLLVFYAGHWWMAECKTPGRRLRSDQREQNEFCARFNVPYLRTAEDVRNQLTIWSMHGR